MRACECRTIRRSFTPCGSPRRHGFTEVHPWPVDRGRSRLERHSQSAKGPCHFLRTEAARTLWAFGIPRTQTGTVHFAEYEELPAKKIWSWGVDAEGMDWRKALSDDDSGYIEMQAGLFRNQETYAFLEPRQTIHFRSTGCRCGRLAESRAPILRAWSTSAGPGQRLKSDSTPIVRYPQATVSILNGTRNRYSRKSRSDPRTLPGLTRFRSSTRWPNTRLKFETRRARS